jgi:carbonic anhydrase
MNELPGLFANNRRWAVGMESRQPGFFAELAAHLYRDSLQQLAGDSERLDRLCELNVLVQARRLCRSTIVQQAWERGQRLVVHAWVYRLDDGLLRDLGFGAASLETAEEHYARAAGFGTIGAGEAENRA